MLIEQEIPRVLILDNTGDAAIQSSIEDDLGYEVRQPIKNRIHSCEKAVQQFSPHVVVLDSTDFSVDSEPIQAVIRHKIPVVLHGLSNEGPVVSKLDDKKLIYASAGKHDHKNGVSPTRRLQAHLNSSLRRMDDLSHVREIVEKSVTLDNDVSYSRLTNGKAKLVVQGERKSLSRQQSGIFRVLVENRGYFVSKERIQSLIDDGDMVGNYNSRIHVHIHRIRKLLELSNNAVKDYITTDNDHGYALLAEDQLKRLEIERNPVVRIGNRIVDFRQGTIEYEGITTRLSKSVLRTLFFLSREAAVTSLLSLNFHHSDGISFSISSGRAKVTAAQAVLLEDASNLTTSGDQALLDFDLSHSERFRRYSDESGFYNKRRSLRKVGLLEDHIVENYGSHVNSDDIMIFDISDKGLLSSRAAHREKVASTQIDWEFLTNTLERALILYKGSLNTTGSYAQSARENIRAYVYYGLMGYPADAVAKDLEISTPSVLKYSLLITNMLEHLQERYHGMDSLMIRNDSKRDKIVDQEAHDALVNFDSQLAHARNIESISEVLSFSLGLSRFRKLFYVDLCAGFPVEDMLSEYGLELTKNDRWMLQQTRYNLASGGNEYMSIALVKRIAALMVSRDKKSTTRLDEYSERIFKENPKSNREYSLSWYHRLPMVKKEVIKKEILAMYSSGVSVAELANHFISSTGHEEAHSTVRTRLADVASRCEHLLFGGNYNEFSSSRRFDTKGFKKHMYTSR